METDERDYQTLMKHIEDLHKENRLLTEQLTNISVRGKIESVSSNYISIKTLAVRIGYAVKTIYNLISHGQLKESVHYFKPTKRKVLFYWPAMEQWIRKGHDG